MDNDRIAGAAKQARGVIKKGAGKVSGNKKLVAEGMKDEVVGKIQSTFGKAKDALKKLWANIEGSGSACPPDDMLAADPGRNVLTNLRDSPVGILLRFDSDQRPARQSIIFLPSKFSVNFGQYMKSKRGPSDDDKI
jgi:uncharacterized protein YjbJ (UPF0337 family)